MTGTTDEKTSDLMNHGDYEENGKPQVSKLFKYFVRAGVQKLLIRVSWQKNAHFSIIMEKGSYSCMHANL